MSSSTTDKIVKRGKGRPRKNLIRFTCFLTPATYQRIRDEAQQRESTLGEVVERLVREEEPE